MAHFYSSYYGLSRVFEQGPEVKGWAVTDSNVETLSLLLRRAETHVHSGSTPIGFPGYNQLAPATPATPILTEVASSGVLSPGTEVGVRLAYKDSSGLESVASPETIVVLSPLVERPPPVALATPLSTPVGGALQGGTYIYAVTKRQGTGETEISDVRTIDVPFASSTNTSWTLPITFDGRSTYTDGTDGVKLYRSTGFNQAFQLVATVSTPVYSYTHLDNNVIENTGITPPTANTFGKNRKVTITWSHFSHPSAAKYLRVYVTQSPSGYAVNNLLAELDMRDPSTPLPTYVDYLGSEVLSKGWPNDFGQIPGSPSKIQLDLEATGAPILTKEQDFAGFRANRFVFPSDLVNATPIEGGVYYDSSTKTIKVRLNSVWTTLATPTGSYVHAAIEQGGHAASAIKYPTTGGTTVDQVLDIIATPVGKFRKQVQFVNAQFYAPDTVPKLSTSGTAATPIGNGLMTLGSVSPDFAGQQVTNNFGVHLQGGGVPTAGSYITANVGLEYDGIVKQASVRAVTFATPTFSHSLDINYTTPFTKSAVVVRPVWWVNTGTINLIRSQFSVRKIL